MSYSSHPPQVGPPRPSRLPWIVVGLVSLLLVAGGVVAVVAILDDEPAGPDPAATSPPSTEPPADPEPTETGEESTETANNGDPLNFPNTPQTAETFVDAMVDGDAEAGFDLASADLQEQYDSADDLVEAFRSTAGGDDLVNAGIVFLAVDGPGIDGVIFRIVSDNSERSVLVFVVEESGELVIDGFQVS